MPPDNSYGDLGFIASLAFQPVLGEALWQIKPDFSVRDGLEVAFAPGYEVPDAYVEDVKRLTYTAYDDSPGGNDDFLAEEPLDQRMKATAKPLMVLMGAEEQIVNDPQRALDQYKRAVPAAQIHLIAGAGHSPNVERPALVAKLVLRFAKEPEVGLPSPQHRASGVRSATGHQ
jgi:pimeloyl-ACP methyl ester carboxylesterase